MIRSVQPIILSRQDLTGLKGRSVMKLLKYIPLLIAFLAVSVLAGLGANQQVFATENNDEVLDHFEMEQEAGTSGGTTKRHIDISSAWSGAYIYENMTVEGKAEIKESFSMNNIKSDSGSSNNSSIDSGSSGESDNPSPEQGDDSSAAENNSGDESNSDSGSNPGSGENNKPNSDNKPELELETMAVPEWVDLF